MKEKRNPKQSAKFRLRPVAGREKIKPPFVLAVDAGGMYVCWPGPNGVNLHLEPVSPWSCGVHDSPVPDDVRAMALAGMKTNTADRYLPAHRVGKTDRGPFFFASWRETPGKYFHGKTFKTLAEAQIFLDKLRPKVEARELIDVSIDDQHTTPP